ncbi:OmpA family protein [Saccharothrix variisporea]|uniref:OmpA family protein n=1 Tax=Saccharothrix variisporea TaxID=543527 RepID=A0A495XH41_9PSEU|nr:OmpA family protein [Saccharothrix variisporea]RKT70898.1 OmpA family protein [Saccharothrix variisporea]
MTHRRTRRVVTGCLVLAALAACSTASPPAPRLPAGCPVDAGQALTLVVGARMGSPRPTLPGEVEGLVEVAARSERKVQVVRVDGQPTVALAADVRITGKNETQREKQVSELVGKVKAFVEQLEPKQAEADVLGALAEAARVTPEGGTVVLVDSGLATAGAVSFREEGMWGANPGEVAAFLAAQRLLPGLTGRSVLLVGLGGTADPQPALNEDLRGRVGKLWREVVTKAGATCSGELAIPSRRDAFPTTVPVTVVKLPEEPKPVPCGTTKLEDSGSVGFVPDTADLRDPAAADRTLQSLAGVVAGGAQRVTLVGNTAGGGPAAGHVELSTRRAEAVKSILVRLGVPADRIATRGDGNSGPYHENDLGPDGVLIPAAAARNRSVVVELSCPQ